MTNTTARARRPHEISDADFVQTDAAARSRSVGPSPGLLPEDLSSLTEHQLRSVLGYLDLPPLGAYDDSASSPDVARHGGHELPPAVREPLLRRREAAKRFKAPSDILGVPGFGPEELASLVDLLSDRERYGHAVSTLWGGPRAHRCFFDLLEGAERTIHISTFIVGGDAGLEMARILARKVREGVKVRLLFCASGFVVSGSPSGTGFVSPLSEMRSYLVNDMYRRRRILRLLREAEVPFINSAPIGRHWKRRALRDAGVRDASDYERWAVSRGIPAEWLDEQERIDRECGLAFANVDHRKMVLIDGERALIGSQNIADSYFFTNELHDDPRVNVRRWQWHDNSALLTGGCVRKLERLFVRRWALSGGDLYDPDAGAPPLDAAGSPSPGDAVVTPVTSIPGMMSLPLSRNLPRLLASTAGANLPPVAVGSNPIRERLMALPEVARHDLYVEHCYPADSGLLEHWSRVGSRLSDFTLVFPEHYDTKIMGLECDRHYAAMLAAGLDVRGYSRAIMHSKIAVADGFYVTNGSYNLTLRSARADLELQFFIQDRAHGESVRERIRGDLEDCRPMRPSPIDKARGRVSLPLLDAPIRYFIL